MPTLRNRITRVLVATAATAFAVGCPAVAVADTQLITTCPQPTETGGVIDADTVTECSTPGNIQLNASPEMPARHRYSRDSCIPHTAVGGKADSTNTFHKHKCWRAQTPP